MGAHEDTAPKTEALCWQSAYAITDDQLRDLEVRLVDSDDDEREVVRAWALGRMPSVLDGLAELEQLAAETGASAECLSALADVKRRIKAMFDLDGATL